MEGARSRVLTWRRSTSCADQACVEAAGDAENVYVRDAKERGGPVLTFTRAEWAAFCDGVRRGDFDRL